MLWVSTGLVVGHTGRFEKGKERERERERGGVRESNGG